MPNSDNNILLTILTNIIDLITGPLGTTICGLALIVAGVMFIMGYGSRRMVLGVVAGVVLIWGSSFIISHILGINQ